MSQLVSKEIEKWNIPADIGVGKGKGPLFKEESPAQPITTFQAWVQWQNLAGGGATSVGELRCYCYSTYLGSQYSTELYFSFPGDNLPLVYQPYNMFTGAAPADGRKLVRIGNFNIQDGRQLKIYAENIYFVVTASGTAYTGGFVEVAPIGWIEG